MTYMSGSHITPSRRGDMGPRVLARIRPLEGAS